jgi:hypothetical protein
MMIASINVHNSLIYRRDIELFESMFHLLRFKSNEIREMRCFKKFADLMIIDKIENEHFEI